MPIEIPPLRARREDIEPLARFLLARVAARHGREVRFSPEAIRAILRYPWPGNVRELENAIEYAVAVGQGQTIHSEDLPLLIVEPETVVRPEPMTQADGLRMALEQNRWQRDATAKALGISRTTLWRKMREAGLVDNVSR